MTDLTFDPAALRALLDAMPDAPWRVALSQPNPGIRTAAGWEVVHASYDDHLSVLEFIAAARNELPALLDALAAAREELAEAKREEERYRQEARDSATQAGRALRELRETRAEADKLRAHLAEVRRLCDSTIWILNANDVRAVLDAVPAAAPQADDDPLTVACPHCLAEIGAACHGYGIGRGMHHSNRRYALRKLATAPQADESSRSVYDRFGTRRGVVMVDAAADDELVPHVETVSEATLAGMAAIGQMRNPEVFAPWEDEEAAVPGDGEQAATTFCGHAYIGNVGEFTCDRLAGHDAHHWNLLAEFGWPNDATALPTSGQA